MLRINKWFFLISFFILILSSLELSAATIILKNGATVKGALIDKTDSTVTIQDQWTKQLRSINSDAILSLTLEADEQKIVDKKKKKIFVGDNILTTLQPTIGIMPGIAYPVGKIGSRIGIGFGFNAFADVAIPVKPDLMAVRFGLSVGYLYHGTTKTDYSSSIMHLPVDAYVKLQFLTSMGLRPYIKVGGGITPVISGSATDIAPSVVAAAGLGYSPNKIPYMEFFIEAGYRMVFESLRGDFVTANIGVAYRFGAPASIMTLKPAGK